MLAAMVLSSQGILNHGVGCCLETIGWDLPIGR